jgi:hypothetical protein
MICLGQRFIAPPPHYSVLGTLSFFDIRFEQQKRRYPCLFCPLDKLTLSHWILGFTRFRCLQPMDSVYYDGYVSRILLSHFLPRLGAYTYLPLFLSV